MLRGSHMLEKWVGVLAVFALLGNACDANSTSGANDATGGASAGSNAVSGMAGVAPMTTNRMEVLRRRALVPVTSVCPKPDNGTLIHFQTHGHLSATLVNEADASDHVELNLDF